MKIAVASDGNFVSGHFGHCESFTLYEADDGKVKNKFFNKIRDTDRASCLISERLRSM